MTSPKLKLRQSALTAGELIVVTGANGYVGSHVVDSLLKAGFRVRGTVRDVKRCSWMEEILQTRYGQESFELAEVQDIALPNSFAKSFQGASGIVHCATDTRFGGNAMEVMKTSVQGVINALEAAKDSGSVTRFVLTSSSGALYTPGSDENNPQVVDKNTWNDRAIAYVDYLQNGIGKEVPSPAPGVPKEFLIYSASKAVAERTLFEWVDREKPGFVANSVLPAMNTGKILSYIHQGFPSSSGMVASLFQAKSWEDPTAKFLKFLPAQWWIDVEDDARLHVAALVHPSLRNERVFAFHKRCNLNDFLDVFRVLSPSRQFPPKLETGHFQDPHDAGLEVLNAEKILKEVGFEGFMVDMAKSLANQLAPIIDA